VRRVPVFLQNSATECGAACLAMILSFHGHRTTVQEVTDRLQVGRDGLSALAIVHAARELGLNAKAFSLEPADLGRVPMPAIVHWEFQHFVVAERWTPDHVDIVDPGQGRRRLTPAEFDAGFTGVLLAFEPEPGFRRVRSSAARAWRRDFLRTLVLRRKGLIAQVLAASVLLQVLGLGLATAFQIVVDRILPRGDSGPLALLGVAVLVAVVTQFAVSYLRSVLLVALRSRTDGEVTRNLVSHLVALPYRYFAVRGKGDLANRSNSVIALRETQGQAPAIRLAHRVLKAVWEEDKDPGDEATLAALIAETGQDAPALLHLAADPRWAAQRAADTEAAIARGVFGAPTCILGEEIFWGQDRLDFLERRLARGG